MNNGHNTTNAQEIFADLCAIRTQAPLVHSITNLVVMNFTANALLALGASPVMAHALEELPDMVKLANALVVNIGTLSSGWVESMRTAVTLAANYQIPVILDPVGAGATRYRTQCAQVLLQTAPIAVIRGNASEIMALHSDNSATKGVDSQHASAAALSAAQALSAQYRCTVSVSGATDYIVAPERLTLIHNGHPLMTRITGMGCSASVITAAFCAVNPDYFTAAVHAMAIMGICGEAAQKSTQGPGSLAVAFLDLLHNLDYPTIERSLRLESN